MKFDEEHGKSVAAAVHLTEPAAAPIPATAATLLPATTALLPARARGATAAVWTGLPATTALLPARAAQLPRSVPYAVSGADATDASVRQPLHAATSCYQWSLCGGS